LPQKSDVGGFAALHFAQCLATAFPHFAQKLLPDGLFVPHFEQCMPLYLREGLVPVLYHPTPRTGQTDQMRANRGAQTARLAR
jgi:hypothetical protein